MNQTHSKIDHFRFYFVVELCVEFLSLFLIACCTCLCKKRINTRVRVHGEIEPGAQEFATRLALGTLANLEEVDARIRSRAEHWRITRMALVDRNVLRLAVYEFLREATPRTVAINEALEIARRFSTYEATQFINGILDAIKRDLDQESPEPDNVINAESEDEESPEVAEPE